MTKRIFKLNQSYRDRATGSTKWFLFVTVITKIGMKAMKLLGYSTNKSHSEYTLVLSFIVYSHLFFMCPTQTTFFLREETRANIYQAGQNIVENDNNKNNNSLNNDEKANDTLRTLKDKNNIKKDRFKNILKDHETTGQSSASRRDFFFS